MFDEFEYCIICGKRTEKVGLLDDSLYIGEIGPLCGDCYEKSGIIELEAENERLVALLNNTDRLDALRERLKNAIMEYGVHKENINA